MICDFSQLVDLVNGHLAALRVRTDVQQERSVTVNLGTGRGFSVLELVMTFAGATVASVYGLVARRKGDVTVFVCRCNASNRAIHGATTSRKRDRTRSRPINDFSHSQL